MIRYVLGGDTFGFSEPLFLNLRRVVKIYPSPAIQEETEESVLYNMSQLQAAL
jgi:hypothetical protein